MFPFRTVVVGTFLPTILFEIGVGAVLPIIASSATRLGAGLTLAGLLVSLVPVGQILWDVPAGALAARIGDRQAMIVSGVIAAVGSVTAALAVNVAMLAAAVLLLGAAAAGFFLARQSYLTEITPPLRRARVLSTLGGVHRIGQFIGPFIGAALITVGSLTWSFWLSAVTALLAILVVWLVKDDDARAPAPSRAAVVSVGDVWREHWRVFTTLGVAVLLIGAVRGARTTVLPLWAEYVGIDPAHTSLIFGVAGAVDMLLFYPAGKVMDRLGRLWIGIPGMVVMGAALAVLPLTHAVTSIGAVAVLLGLGNGMTSGILMTLGADVAPPAARAQFLGLWRILSDTGGAVGPLVLTAASAAGAIAVGIWVMAASSLASVAAQAVWVPKFSVHANRRTRRAAGLIP